VKKIDSLLMYVGVLLTDCPLPKVLISTPKRQESILICSLRFLQLVEVKHLTGTSEPYDSILSQFLSMRSIYNRM
jgi:hypothetical protein